jgi:hypothetical protein
MINKAQLFRIFSIIILFASSSFAKFHLAEKFDVPLPKAYSQAMDASIRLIVTKTDGKFGACSGTFVSNDGVFITARHCLQSCLVDLGAVVVTTTSSAPNSEYMQIDPDKIRGNTCKMLFDLGDITVPVTAKILATGMGDIMNPTATLAGNPKKYLELIDSGIGPGSGDFIVLKLQTSQTIACVPLATKAATPKDRVWTFSFPGITNRGDGFDSNGTSLYISYGPVRGGHADSEYPPILKSSQEFRQGVTEDVANYFLKVLFDLKYAIWSDLDTTPGSSGGSILNEGGELVGINTQSFSNTTAYYAGSSVGLSIEWIKSEIKFLYPEVDLDKTFGCRRN